MAEAESNGGGFGAGFQKDVQAACHLIDYLVFSRDEMRDALAERYGIKKSDAEYMVLKAFRNMSIFNGELEEPQEYKDFLKEGANVDA